MKTQSVFNTQCKTFSIAKKLAYAMSNVSSFEGAFKPPFCLRVVKQYRTIEMQAFRNEVAKVERISRLSK